MTDRDRRRGHIYETTAVIHVNGNGNGTGTGGSTRRRRSKSKHGQGRDPMHFAGFRLQDETGKLLKNDSN